MVILVGSIYYSYVKNEEMIAKLKQTTSTTSGPAYERVPMHVIEEGKKTANGDPDHRD